MLKRTITGLSLGGVMIFSLLYHLHSALWVLLLILSFSALEWNQHFVKKLGTIIIVGFLVSIIIIGISCIYEVYVVDVKMANRVIGLVTPICLLHILVCVLAVLLPKGNWLVVESWFSGIFYIGLPIWIAVSFLIIDFDRHTYILLLILFMNWGNDIMAYMLGRLIGKTPLAPNISPKKTLEGFYSGLFGSLLCTFILNEYILPFQTTYWLLIPMAIVIWLFGTAGDLYESKLKRSIQIKDSGTLLPGHGGFLDRFDSFFFIVPVGIIFYVVATKIMT